jgi:protein arginine kinase activator
MKCSNCGRNEANFHYQSNINGQVTEAHLCSDCAAKLGYNNNLFFDTDHMFENMMSDFFGMGRRSLSPFGGFGLTMPTFAVPTMVLPRIEIKYGDGSGAQEQKAETQADPEMKKRRELNMLKEQMKAAADAEDFEKAAQIRDSIKKLEGTDGEAKEQ